nr:hypothetical protein [Tanacetum cinerariifolium]
MNEQKKMMRLDEIHKFNDDTLLPILNRLDHMVKDFMLFQFNPGMENIIWFEDDKRRSKEFMEAIERRLKIRRIFRSLESFVGGQLRDVDYQSITRTTWLHHSGTKGRNWVNTSAVRITKMIADIEESRHRPSDAMHNPP